MVLGIIAIFVLYLAVSGLCFFIHNMYSKNRDAAKGYSSLKTVTFGDESSVVATRTASVAAVITLFLFWGIATGSNWLPFGLPGPFVGDTSFEYTAIMLRVIRQMPQCLYAFIKRVTKMPASPK